MKEGTTRKTNRQQTEVLGRATRSQIRKRAAQERLTVGLDLGDRNSSYCILNEQGEILLQNVLSTTQAGLGEAFACMQTLSDRAGGGDRWRNEPAGRRALTQC